MPRRLDVTDLRAVSGSRAQKEASAQALALAWLAACLENAERALREEGCDVEVVAAHRAQLLRGREWPGDPIDAVAQEEYVHRGT